MLPFLPSRGCLRPFELLQLKKPLLRGLKNKHSFRTVPEAEVRNQGARRPSVWLGPASCCSHVLPGGRREGALTGLFSEGTNPLQEDSTLLTS